MNRIRRTFGRLAGDQRGLTTVEYVIALCLVGAVAVGMWRTFGTTVRTSLVNANTEVSKQTKAGIADAKMTK